MNLEIICAFGFIVKPCNKYFRKIKARFLQNEKVLEGIQLSAEGARCEKQGVYFRRMKKRMKNFKRMKINRFLKHGFILKLL